MTTSERPRARLDRWLDAAEALLWLGLLGFGSAVALTVFREASPPPPSDPFAEPADIIEAEALPVVDRSRAFTFWQQPTDGFARGRWSGDAQMLGTNTRRGDWIELGLPERTPGPRRIELFLTRAADYGVVRIRLNGRPLGGPIDLFSDAGVVPTGAVDLGVVTLGAEGDRLRIEVVGTNERSAPPHFQFGIDGVRLSAP
ncbi:MAG: hypothetical protein ABFS41_11065 [Myxococcota bacterium]